MWLRAAGGVTDALPPRVRLLPTARARRPDGADEEKAVSRERQPARDEPAQSADADKRGEGGAGDDLDRGGAHARDDDRRGERELHLANTWRSLMPRPRAFSSTTGHGAQPGVGVDDQRRSGQQVSAIRERTKVRAQKGNSRRSAAGRGRARRGPRCWGHAQGRHDRDDRGTDPAAAGGEHAQRHEDRQRQCEGVERSTGYGPQRCPEPLWVVLDVAQAFAEQIHDARGPVRSRYMGTLLVLPAA